jgi:hypothetical protein
LNDAERRVSADIKVYDLKGNLLRTEKRKPMEKEKLPYHIRKRRGLLDKNPGKHGGWN